MSSTERALDAIADPTINPDKKTLLRRAFHGVYSYEGGYNGSCFECPFADGPYDSADGMQQHDYIHNCDHTEAYFRCTLPGRDNEAFVWGEDAPCTADEWVDGVLASWIGASSPAGAPSGPGVEGIALHRSGGTWWLVDHAGSVSSLSSRTVGEPHK